MPNGCICCTLRDDLLEGVRRLAGEDRFDYLLIESTGISEPLPVAATFDFRDEAGNSLSNASRLDTIVTVVDAANLLNDYSSYDFLSDRDETMGEEDDRTLVNLLVKQIEFADVVILNKDVPQSRDYQPQTPTPRGRPDAGLRSPPSDLRLWVTSAMLPWRPKSVRCAFDRAMARAETRADALRTLDRFEMSLVAKDGQKVWGERYPLAGSGS